MRSIDPLFFRFLSVMISAFLVASAVSPIVQGTDDITSSVLFDFEDVSDLGRIDTVSSSVNLIPNETGHALHVMTNLSEDLPSIFLRSSQGHWDLSKYEYIELDVRNLGVRPVTVWCRILPKRPRTRHMGSVTLEKGECGTIKLILSRSIVPVRLSEPVEFINMDGAPGQLDSREVDYALDKGDFNIANIEQISLFVLRSSFEHSFEIDNIRAGGRIVKLMDPEDFFPFVDEFGQFIHEEWPGKTHSTEELIRHREQEAQDLALNPGPSDWDKYGGWVDGPQLEATGFFRTENHSGKWWLVDPEGRLFWSHGCCGVNLGARPRATTPLTDRMHYFRYLPEYDSPLARFYSERRVGEYPKGLYYTGRETKSFSFLSANLYRKYGEAWRESFAEIQFKRIRSWGLNTLGNWSTPSQVLKVPYFRYIRTGNARAIEGSEGYWRQLPDPFDPSFRKGLRENFEKEIGVSAGDPWLIGYFVDHEHSWGDEVSLSLATLASPPDQPAKKVFIDTLRAKYGAIDKLNDAWNTNYPSWDEVQRTREVPDSLKNIVVQDISFIGIIKPTRDPNKEEAWADLSAFYTRIAEAYFRISREELKRVAPNNLYFGSPFSSFRNDHVIRAAAKYCDVVGFDLYENPGYIAAFKLPEACVDKPVCICEWHVGACDRGMFHTGLMGTANQVDRAEAYKEYVKSALGNPNFVGTHWFTIGTQELTGRMDGENYSIGFTDVCDTPYEEIIRASREVGYNLYAYRLRKD
jgi:hypothetical protein